MAELVKNFDGGAGQELRWRSWSRTSMAELVKSGAQSRHQEAKKRISGEARIGGEATKGVSDATLSVEKRHIDTSAAATKGSRRRMETKGCLGQHWP
jgi:hypothetical protein